MTTHHRIIPAAVVALALAAGTAPAAARYTYLGAAHSPNVRAGTQPPPGSGQPGWVVQPNPDEQAARLARTAAAPPILPAPRTPAARAAYTVRVTGPGSGFDWGDAGIGAAGGFALSMLGLGSALAVSQRRVRRLRGSATATS